MRKRNLLFLLVLFFVSSTVEAKLMKPTKPHFDIQHYKIELVLSEKDSGFKTKTEITLKSLVPNLQEITLHYKEGSKKVPLSKPLNKGEVATITVEGEGTASARSQDGLFAVYPDPKGMPQFYTQFESTGARQVFPCYDEPFEKATTEVTITANKKYTLLSNGTKSGEEILENGQKRVHFKNNDPISTYHITFVAAELVPVTSQYSSKFGKKIPLTIYTRPGTQKDVRYPMEVLQKALAFFEDYFGIPYPWESYGIVALPGFTWGGMENKGLANLNESRLLWNPSHLLQKKLWIVGLIAHELAHEWFGNLVTMEWWDDLWLNEAFATFMNMKFEEHLFGKDYVAIDNYQWLAEGYFPQDQGPLSHPIVLPQIDSLDEIFDSITYAKGVQVVRMLEDLIGPENFQKGLRDYFQKHRLGNATTKDFLAAMERASGKDLKQFARGWLMQKGFPRLSLEGKWDAKTQKMQLKVIQEGIPFEFPLKVGDQVLQLSKAEHFFQISAAREEVLPVNRDGKALVEFQWRKPLLKKGLEDQNGFVRFHSFSERLKDPFEKQFTLKEMRVSDSLRETFLKRLRDPSRAVAAGALWAATRNDLDENVNQKLADAVWKEAKDLFGHLSKTDPIDAQLRQSILILLGQAQRPDLHSFLKEQVTSHLFDDRLGALAGILRSKDPERYAIFEKTLKEHAALPHAKLELFKVLATTPKTEVLAKINQYLADPQWVSGDDSTTPTRVWRAIHQDNKGVVYTKEGVAEVVHFVERNLDRELVAGTALRTLEDAGKKGPELKKEIQKGILGLLKKNPPDYVKSVGEKILASAQ